MKTRIVLIVMALAATYAGCSKDDAATTPSPQPTIAVQDQSVVEGNTALFQVRIDQSTDHRVTFTYSTIEGTALAGSDFTSVSGVDTIPQGQTSVTILVLTSDDSEIESSESFSFVLSAVTGAQVSRGLATCTISDNDYSDVSFATQVRPLLRTSCAKLGTCHGGTFPGGGMFLDTSATYTNVISATGTVTGGLVVAAGNSASSTLYTKTTDTWGFRSRMPLALAPLSLQQQALIRNWIDQGALDN